MLDIFKLVKERCLLSSLNIRTEMHGDQRESAIDIAFEFDSANNLLLKLHPELRATFYRGDDTKDLVTPDHLPHLKFPLCGPVSWELEIPRTLLRVHDVDDEAHDVVLGGGRTNKFKLTLKQGGTVNWKFRVQFSKPDEEQVARLMRVLNQKVPVSLECVDEEEKRDNFEQVEQLSLTGTAPSAARLELESLFDKAPTDMTIGPEDALTVIVLPEVISDKSIGEFKEVIAEFHDDHVFNPGSEQVATVTPIKKRASRKTSAAEIE